MGIETEHRLKQLEQRLAALETAVATARGGLLADGEEGAPAVKTPAKASKGKTTAGGKRRAS